MKIENILSKIILAVIQDAPQSEREFFNLVRKNLTPFKIKPPEKSALLSAYHNLVKNKKTPPNPLIEKILTKRAVRTLSGVAVISVLTKPFPCPGKCLYCPTEKAMPKSYLSNEPAVMRAILNKFDPYDQVNMRLKALQANGHATDKIELIVMGGTWSCHRPQYQTWFIKRCFDALNKSRSSNLKTAQKKNETAKHRCIGLTLETRPDYVNETEIKRMRHLGCTRVELGIQHIDDKILKLNHRGHGVAESIRAIKLLKQAGFKLNYHLMLNLPGSTPAKDLAMFKKIYSQPEWLPDMVKIYPCVVTKDAPLYRLWKAGQYKPYSDKQLLDLIIKIKKITPPWVRITRLIRDIPEESIIAGNKTTNLRQLIQERTKHDNWSCRCIRCREAGHQNQISNLDFHLNIIRYRALAGTEYFLSFDSKNKKVLYAFLRLRINDQPENNFIPELKNAALIREVHTYGQMTPLGRAGEVQHLGLGKKLLAEAEELCQKNNIKKIAVIAGIGVRKYYAKFGYQLHGDYMVKNLEG